MEQFPFDKPLKIDRRPIWLILFDRTFHYQIFAGLLLLCALLFSLTPPQGLSVQGYHAMILFGATIFLWISGLLPLAVTSLLAMAMIPLLGIMDAKRTYAMFGNESVFFILGAFILAAAMTGSGFSTRLARGVLANFGKTPKTLVLTVYLLCASLSFCMSEHAVAAMMFPIVTEIGQSLRLDSGKSTYGKLLFLSIAWGCVIGGIATFLGGARAPLAVGMLRETTGLDFSFFEWTMASIMIVIPLLVIGFVLLLRIFPPDVDSVEEGLKFLSRKRLEAGRMSYNEMIVAVIMVATILAWVFLGKKLGLAAIATLAVAALFACRVVTWQVIEEYVNWGVILMYGGAIAIASALEKTGAAEWLAGKGLAELSNSPFMVITVISLISLLLTECISNAAVIAILLPIGISLAKSMGIDPRVMTLAVTLPAGLAYCLPMGTPANAIVYSSGFLSSREMIKYGAIIMAISWLLFLISARFIWPFLGFTV